MSDPDSSTPSPRPVPARSGALGTVVSMLFALAVAVIVSHAHHPRQPVAGARDASSAGAVATAPSPDGRDPSVPSAAVVMRDPTSASAETPPSF